MYFSKSLAIGLPLSRTDTKRDGSCPSVSNGVDPPTFYTLCKHFNEFLLSLSRSDFRSVEPTQRETDRVRPCPTESIRQHFTPSVNTSVYFSKSLAIGLPLSRTDTKRDGSCPSVSNGVDPPTFYTLCKHFNVFF